MWSRPKQWRVTVAPGFFLLAAVFLYLDQGVGYAKWYAVAACSHELGHVLAAKILGGYVERLSLSVVGAEIKFSYSKILSYGEENLVLLAGAAMNLIIGAAVGARLPILAAANFGMGIFNLLPAMPLDGGGVLSNLLTEGFGFSVSENVMLACTAVVSGLLLGVGLVLAAEYANVILLILSVWLLVSSAGKNFNFSSK